MDPFEPFLDDPANAGVFTDYDGTLAPIVADPWSAQPLDGTTNVRHQLAGRFQIVGVLSGRPLDFLIGQLGEGLWLSGLYGLETLENGRRVEAPQAAEWRPVVAAAVERARHEFGDAVEPKGLSLTLHFRIRPDIGPAVRSWAEADARASGLMVRSAKASIELHPPVKADKGTVIERAAAGLRAVCFLGDDVGDLPAYDGLDRLRDAGVHTVRVGVATEEAPPELLARADVVVDGPIGALALLQRLAADT